MSVNHWALAVIAAGLLIYACIPDPPEADARLADMDLDRMIVVTCATITAGSRTEARARTAELAYCQQRQRQEWKWASHFWRAVHTCIEDGRAMDPAAIVIDMNHAAKCIRLKVRPLIDAPPNSSADYALDEEMFLIMRDAMAVAARQSQ